MTMIATLTPITTPIASLDTLIWGPECPAKDRRFDLLRECDDADREFHSSYRASCETHYAHHVAKATVAYIAALRSCDVQVKDALDYIMEGALDGKVDVPTYRFIRALAALELDRVAS